MPKKQKKKNDSKSKEESVNKSSNKENKNYIENSSQQNLESIEELKNNFVKFDSDILHFIHSI